jgi:hypothetical protein
MQITIDIPDNLTLTEADVRIELAIVLYQQQNQSANVLFPGCVSAAIADSPFPDNASAIALQVTTINFGKFICLFATLTPIISYL